MKTKKGNKRHEVADMVSEVADFIRNSQEPYITVTIAIVGNEVRTVTTMERGHIGGGAFSNRQNDIDRVKALADMLGGAFSGLQGDLIHGNPEKSLNVSANHLAYQTVKDEFNNKHPLESEDG